MQVPTQMLPEFGMLPLPALPPKFLHVSDQNNERFLCPQNQKIINVSRAHKETFDATKLQTSMVHLMYSGGDIDWEEGTVMGICLGMLRQKYKNLLEMSASVQVIQSTNCLTLSSPWNLMMKKTKGL